ncbi:MAG: kynureninase [Gammaproteobacteria bacterium]|jgi:kynureninase
MASPDLPLTNHANTHALSDTTTPDRSVAEQLDAADALAEWRERFVLCDPARIYLDGNSLGMTPIATVEAVHRVIEEQWAGDLITSWWKNDWLDLPLTVGNELAPLLGADHGTVAVHDSTTVGIFQLLNVALDLPKADGGTRPPVLAFAPSEFPTDRYAAEGVARLRNGAVRSGLDDLDGVGVVVRSMVDYRSAEIYDVAAETARATTAEAITVWDLSHAVGVLDLDLPALGVDLAVGCTYKFLNGGPGAPGFTYVAPHLHNDVTQPIWGWFGQTDQFAMDNAFDPRPGIGRLLHGTPGILGLTAARSGIATTVEAGISAIAAKARAITQYGILVADALGLAVASPRDATVRGGHVAIRHPDAVRVHRELEARGVIVDKRDPDILRLGMSPLTTRFVDVYDALVHLADIAGIPAGDGTTRS